MHTGLGPLRMCKKQILRVYRWVVHMILHKHSSMLLCLHECAALAVGLLHMGRVQGIQSCKIAQQDCRRSELLAYA